MRQLLFLVAAQLFAATSFAQTSSISGTVANAFDSIPLSGANIVLTKNDSNKGRGVIADFDGNFSFDNVTDGAFLLKISYVGYQDFTRKIRVNGRPIQLGILPLQEEVEELKEAVVTGQAVRVLQKGDTLQYNANAYKTLPDASAEDLLEKMPTVVIENGKVQAEGEDVKQVLVDGKRFFGDDPTAAIRNLPAEVIDKIEIFDKQSDQAEFTGFDDGETSKTINIVTKADRRNGQFGKIYVGYGSEDKYQAGGNINLFSGDQRISIIGMANNVNQQNFSTEDLLGVVGSSGGGRGGGQGGRGGGQGGRGGGQGGGRGGNSSGASANDFLVGQQAGITDTQSGGINFTDEWGDKVDVSASYFFNRSDNVSDQLMSQQFFDDGGFNELYDEKSSSQNTNTNHRFNGQLDFEIDSLNSLTWRPKLSFQTNDGIQSIFGQTLLGADVLNQTDNDFNADLSALSFSNDLIWKHKFTKPRRTLSVRLNTRFSPKKGESYLFSENSFGNQPADTLLIDQYATLDLNSWNASANLQYTEPLGEKSMLMLNYRTSYQQEESNKETFDFNEETTQYDLFDQGLSNVFSNDYFTQQAGGGYNYRSGGLTLMARANLQWANLLNEQTAPFENTYENTFWNVLPMAMLRYTISRKENLRLAYRTNTQLPSIEQLQNVVDNNNPLQLTVGNPDLVQSYGHNLFARYTKSNTDRASVFFAMVGGSLTNGYIANSTYLSGYDLPELEGFEAQEGAQLTRPVNLDGQWALRSFMTYGFPVSALKSNLNIDLTSSFGRTPGIVNDALNYSNSTTVGAGLTLGSSFNDRLDFTLSSRSNYNTVGNSLVATGNTQYFNQNTRLKFNAIIGSGFVFRTDLTHQWYTGLDETFDQNYLLWNMSIGKKVFKNDRGEISLSVFDLLDQNNSLTRNATETYIEDVQTNVLQQYFMLGFKYDLRHFRVNKK